MKSFKFLIAIIFTILVMLAAIFSVSCTNRNLYLEEVDTTAEAEFNFEDTGIGTNIDVIIITGEATDAAAASSVELPPTIEIIETAFPTRAEIALAYKNAVPSAWGQDIPGVITIFPTNEKIIALTFDACGGRYDEELIEFLIDNNIPATLFITGKWIADNPGCLEYLSAQNNFQIENHGSLHMPLSVTGRSEYNIRGTSSPEEVFDEVEKSALLIEEITGRRPKFFRSGTAFYDDVAINIVNDLGMFIAGFTISADGGATFSESQILSVCSNPLPGSILLFHMNRPERNTFEGVQSLYAVLSNKNYSFVKMDDIYAKEP
jgi:peptidoglycan/xylan/chitin deacetylase (PgdA/CDA1 family)